MVSQAMEYVFSDSSLISAVADSLAEQAKNVTTLPGDGNRSDLEIELREIERKEVLAAGSKIEALFSEQSTHGFDAQLARLSAQRKVTEERLRDLKTTLEAPITINWIEETRRTLSEVLPTLQDRVYHKPFII